MHRNTAEFEEQQAWVGRRQHDADWLARNSPAIIARATIFRARVGQRRPFPTSHAAVQYERGFTEFPNQPPGMADSPRMQGYLDAEQAHADELSSRTERRDSAFGELTS